MDKKLFTTSTYMGAQLKISSIDGRFPMPSKEVPVYATINEETGEVKFFIPKEYIKKFKK